MLSAMLTLIKMNPTIRVFTIWISIASVSFMLGSCEYDYTENLVNTTVPASTLDCGENFACQDDSRCFSAADKCDNLPDCDDGSDEVDCSSKACSDDDFLCESLSECMPNKYKCDGSVDCLGGFDEEDCENITCALDTDFQCIDDKRCIVGALRCDGTEHCHDGSDEQGCDRESCQPTEFDCKNDGFHCISLEKKCNGVHDCDEGEDEEPAMCNQTVIIDDSCRKENGGCSHKCVANQHGGHYCECPVGYALGFDHMTCEEPTTTRPRDEDECENNEHQCSHHCDNTQGSYTCRCLEGYRLQEDGYSCLVEGTEPFLWLTNGSSLIQFGLRSNNKQIVNLGGAIQGVDFDIKKEKLFWIDLTKKQIFWANNDYQPKPLVTTAIDNPAALAYDWVHGALYWADAGKHTGGARIEVITIPQYHRTTILSSPDVDNPRAMVVDPRQEQGYIYWSQGGSNTAGIFKSGLDGSDKVALATADVENPTGIVIDFVLDRLYWIDTKLNLIVAWELHQEHDGSQRHTVVTFQEYPQLLFGLAVFEDWIYWAEEISKSVHRLHKFRDEADQSLPNFPNSITSKVVLVHHEFRQPADESYCGADNGGCSHICLPSPHYIKTRCVCPHAFNKTTSYLLLEDGKTCEMRVETPAPIIHKKHPSTTPTTQFQSVKSTESTTSPTNSIHVNRTPTNLPESLDAAMTTDADSSSMVSIWIWIGVGIGGIIFVILLLFIGYKLYARHLAKNLHFDNPVFEQKPLRKSSRSQSNSRNSDSAA